jgi:hypothetical protein
MARRPKLQLRELRKILASFDVSEDASRGKGGHTLFYKEIDDKVVSYPVPSDRDVLDCYVRNCRKKFKLTEADGVSDDKFYSRK